MICKIMNQCFQLFFRIRPYLCFVVSFRCCLCGGGYAGPNLSRTFRVNYTYYKTDSYANIPYELYTNRTDVDSIRKVGSIPSFFDFAAMYGAWGYYSQEISAISQMEYPNSEINQCIFGRITLFW